MIYVIYVKSVGIQLCITGLNYILVKNGYLEQ